MIDQNASNQAPKQNGNKTIYLKDYRSPDFNILATELTFELLPNKTLVHSQLTVQRSAASQATDLVLDGEELELLSLSIDNHALSIDNYRYENNQLTIISVADKFTLNSTVAIQPEKNTQLSGLYQSSGNYCTQCEAEGFRRITFFLDRPDALSVFTVKIIADKTNFPVLLSNGNPKESGSLEQGKHYAVWHDPHPKPSYLFALVAGKLECVSDSFKTMSGIDVALNIYAEPHNVDKCDYALGALKRSMLWDEDVYGREYDLDVYNIVAVDDFNMGAMENKGLNVFNSKYVLALPETATDSDFEGIESVIGHEYFHNWSGNRVTCRDWFQLSLKEGFTVFRDQEFSADMGSRGVKRVGDINVLRTHQFKEDAGPMAHPVRPASYEEINNFYTLTIYNKGAEVLRMMHTLLGEKDFRKGTDLYFDRHDGEAVTTDDFAQALEDASGKSLSQFKRWYSQAGTPTLDLIESYDSGTYSLTVTQSCPETPDGVKKKPFHMPLRVQLIDSAGKVLVPETVIELTEAKQDFAFNNLPSRPILSFLRGFSAPVKVDRDISNDDLETLVQFDDDPFVRFESMQQRILEELLLQYRQQTVNTELPESLKSIYSTLLNSNEPDKEMLAKLLCIPSKSYLSDFCHPIQPNLLSDIREALANQIALTFSSDWLRLYRENNDANFSQSGEAVAKRNLKNLALNNLARLNHAEYFQIAEQQFKDAQCMTDSIAALSALVHNNAPNKDDALNNFYTKWQNNPLVLDKWFSLQTSVSSIDTLDSVKRLCEHSAFSMTNPNKVRALLGAFAHNMQGFHGKGDDAYSFYADKIIELDSINSQVAARMVSVFNQWRSFQASNSNAMQEQLKRIQNKNDLSKDVLEIVSKALSG